MNAPTLERLLASADVLPTLPQVVRHILQTLNDESASADALVHELNTDPAIVARLLAAANSSAFGLAGQVASTRQAILVLGLSTVRRITLATALLDRLGQVGGDGRQFWRHSLGVATCARAIAECLGQPPEVAFSAGLLHDVGQLLMAAVAPEATVLAGERAAAGESIVAAERAVFGYDHAVVGAELACRWRLPGDIVGGIRAHHQPDSGEDGEIGDLIHVAEVLSHALDLGQVPHNRVPAVSEIALLRLGVDWPDLSGQFAGIEARYEGSRLALGL
ncbi:HDOD domain-containing protein [Azospira restricta]|uniref:HDOD domain-containing protein n=1 Tax=Azospira restricta TaxID=404405 RepID=A0A974Y4Z0_9RHOO|nr:HDOD domain-containing protein [Azospira restricta]QRJ64836.1 HDOD domain-containing protein [Azospira restricta]